MANSYFDRFFSEKNVPTEHWELTSPDGTLHLIDSEVVIEHIKLTKGHEAAQIRDILVKIDFHNGNVNHFLKHLAQAIVDNY